MISVEEAFQLIAQSVSCLPVENDRINAVGGTSDRGRRYRRRRLAAAS